MEAATLLAEALQPAVLHHLQGKRTAGQVSTGPCVKHLLSTDRPPQFADVVWLVKYSTAVKGTACNNLPLPSTLCAGQQAKGPGRLRLRKRREACEAKLTLAAVDRL
jgi:hypothetical protein